MRRMLNAKCWMKIKTFAASRLVTFFRHRGYIFLLCFDYCRQDAHQLAAVAQQRLSRFAGDYTARGQKPDPIFCLVRLFQRNVHLRRKALHIPHLRRRILQARRIIVQTNLKKILIVLEEARHQNKMTIFPNGSFLPESERRLLYYFGWFSDENKVYKNKGE